MIEKNESLNIKHFTFEKTISEELIFDPKDDVSDYKWREILKLVNSPLGQHAYALAYAKLLFPQRTEDFKLRPETQKTFEELIDYADQNDDDLLLARKILLPEAHKQFCADKELFQYAKSVAKVIISPLTPRYKFFSDVARMELTFPGIKEESKVVKNRKDEIHPLLSKCGELSTDEELFNFLNNCASFRILYPNHMNELKELNSNTKSKLLRYAKDEKTTSSIALANMKILFAEKIINTDEGIEIIMPKLTYPTIKQPELPEKRNF